jgi:hypothetical protein
MQTGQEPPSVEQLRNAFHHVPGLAALDAAIMGKDACGVLGNGFEPGQASALQAALAAQGVSSEVVEEKSLAPLPQPRQLARLEFAPDALMIDNLLGRVYPLAWNDIWLIAAGRAPMAEFKREEVEKVVMVRQRGISVPKVIKEDVTREERNGHLLLEIIARGAAVRCHAIASRPDAFLLFQCLGSRRGKDASANLALLVRDLSGRAPAAMLNCGAYQMTQDGAAPFSYASQTAFYREMTWLMWMDSTGRMQRP